MKKLIIGALVVVAALVVGLGVFVSKVRSLRGAEYDVLEARLAESVKVGSAEGALACERQALRSANPGKAFFGVAEAVMLVRTPHGDRLEPGNMPATAVRGVRELETLVSLAKEFVVDVPFAEWRRQLERQTIFGFGTRSTDLFIVVVPTEEVLQVDVRSYVTGARLCGGTVPKPEGDETRALYDAVSTALKLE